MGKGHAKNEDQYLDKDGVNEVLAAEVKDSVDKKHTQNTDTDFLRKDGTIPLSADWDIGGSRKILATLIAARDVMGLRLFDYTTGSGIYIEDGGSVGIGIGTPHASALLTLSSTTKGFLPPQMTATQRDAISSPKAGLIIYDTTNDKHDFYDGSVWKAFVSTDVSTFGVGSIPFATDTHHISDDNDNLFWDNTLKRLGVGTNAPDEELDVVGNIAVTGTVDGRDILEDGTALDDLESATTKLQRVSTGVFETAQTEVEYYSPNQHGRIYGTIYRQYHGVKTNTQQMTIMGIERLIDFGGMMNGDMTYRGYTSNGLEAIWIHRETNEITFNVLGWNIDDGWLDYTKY